MGAIQQTLFATARATIAAPTYTAGNPTASADVVNGSFVAGTYTGTVTTITRNSGPGSSINYSASAGNINYSGPIYLFNAGTVSLTLSNAGGSSSGSGTLTVNGIGFTLVTTNRTFASGASISFTPRKTILATSTSGNIIASGSVATGSIPPGTNLQFNQGGNGDVIIAGTPTTPGTYNFTLQVYDGSVSNSSPATSSTITITIT